MSYICGMSETVKVVWDGGVVTGRKVGSGPDGILLAHGAGTNQDHPFMVMLRDSLANAGHTVMTFNYPYTERGSKSPGRAEKLVACHAAAADALRQDVDHLYLAGRSMGGRIGTYVVSEGAVAAGLILYAYPLHPAGKPEKLRVEQFPRIEIPMLFFQGTRDALSRMELFEEYIAPLPNVTVEVLEGATHGTKGGGWTPETMVERLVAATSTWIGATSSGRSNRKRS